ncbi:hypothetical protein [Deinococcus sp.]|uniref:hypothetical protein n=1 Tax=Deinococcus sp. TaxID=47478 RepID=UPI00391A6E20
MTVLWLAVAIAASCVAIARSDARSTLLCLLAILPGTAAIILPLGGGTGVSPFWLFAIVMAGLTILFITRVRVLPRIAVVSLAFATWTALSLMCTTLFPNLMVFAPRGGIDEPVLEPLVLSPSQMGQVLYVFLGALIIVNASLFGKGWREGLEKAAWVVYALMAYELTAFFLGLPPLAPIFGNNEAYSFQTQTAFGLPRLHGPFLEPSQAGMFCGAMFAFSIGQRRRALMLASGVAAFATLGTTGIILVMVVILAVLLKSALRLVTSARFQLLPIVGSLFLLGVSAILVSSAPVILNAVEEATIGKGDTQSYEVRTAADQYAVGLFLQTGGLGVGMAANRPSSLLAATLGNLGVPGLLLFSTLIFMCIRSARGPLAAALAVYILGKVLAGPDFSDPTLWIFLAACAAEGASQELESSA